MCVRGDEAQRNYQAFWSSACVPQVEEQTERQEWFFLANHSCCSASGNVGLLCLLRGEMEVFV